jgi:hypothetical protein
MLYHLALFTKVDHMEKIRTQDEQIKSLIIYAIKNCHKQPK